MERRGIQEEVGKGGAWGGMGLGKDFHSKFHDVKLISRGHSVHFILEKPS